MLNEAETRLFQMVLGPDYVKEAAQEHGGGDVIVGASVAWREARELAQNIVGNSSSTELEKNEISWMFNLEKYVQEIVPVESPTFWQRGLAPACAPRAGDPWEIVGFTEMEMPHAHLPQLKNLRYAMMMALGSLLERDPDLNRAVLDNRVWNRTSVELLLPVNFGRDDLSCVVVRPEKTLQDTKRAAFKAIRKMKKIRSHFMSPVFEHLWYQWSASGYISSPAAMQLSDVSGFGITHPLPSFVQGNGVPLSVVFGDIGRNGILSVGIGSDHRAINPDILGLVHRCIREDVPKLLLGQ